jgi:RluA family pseudouridine synthase
VSNQSLIEILYEDNDIFAINKPAGIHSVGMRTNSEYTVAELLANEFPSARFASPTATESGLANRLDFETSGVLIAARSQEVWHLLRAEFQEKRALKTYLALVEGIPECPMTIAGYMGNRHRGSLRVECSDYPKKRYLFTESELASVVGYDLNGHWSVLLIRSSSGARHQIRCHCAEAEHPLIGDTLYGSQREIQAIVPEINHFVLHALELTINHPTTGQSITISAPPPSYLQDFLTRAGTRQRNSQIR